MEEYSAMLEKILEPDNMRIESEYVYVLISASRRKKLQSVINKISRLQADMVWIVPHFPGDDYGLELCDFDTNLEKRIVEELMYAGVVCSEAICYRRNSEINSVTLVVRSKNLDKSKVIKVANKIFNAPMEIVSISNGEKAGFSVLSVENASRYDILFGSAGTTKADSEKSGDTHSVIKLGNNKILVALCDGMGSGQNAEKTSSLALGLIENFYRAGFDNNLILSSVNKMLTLSGEEAFSAIDAGVIDLNKGTCDLIKLGSPVTYIKSKNGVKRLEANALPLGILEEMKPNIRSCTDF